MGDHRGSARVLRLGRVVGLGMTVAAVSLLATWSASALPVDESGYWWRFQVAAGSPLGPPGVEDGQLHVAADAAGVSALAAVRVNVGDRAVTALVLQEVASSGVISLRACPTSGWAGTSGAGAWADRPPTDRCPGESVPGERVGTSWSFAVADLVDDEGVLDVVIEPGLEEQSVTFAAPGPGTIVVADPPSSGAVDDEHDETAGGPPAQPAFSGPSSPAIPPGPSAHDGALAQLDQLPSSGLAAPVEAVPGAAFERDVSPLPAPTGTARSGDPGSRSPLALLAVAIIAAAWIVRTRIALGGAAEHALFGPLRFAAPSLARAGGALAATVVADEIDSSASPADSLGRT